MRRLILLILLLYVGFVPGPAVFASADVSSALTVSPPALDIGTFFSGVTVTISGEIPTGEDVIVEIIGPKVNSLFNIKGRIGPFWMTRGKVDLENAPALYILLMPSGPQWLNTATALNLGIDSLRQRIKVGRSETDSESLFQMFVKLKRSETLYNEVPGAVSYVTGPDGRRRFSAVCRLPSSLVLGKYSIKATRIINGHKGPELSTDLAAQQVGFVKMVDMLASQRRLTYGVSAVLIALFAGAVMGLIFKGGGGH